MDKVGGKKQVASKKKEKKTENKIRIVKKMRGGGPFVFNQNLENFKIFVRNNFQHKSELPNYLTIKESILRKINNYNRESQTRATFNNHIFYIYDTKDNRVTSIGIVGSNGITENGRTKIRGKEYLFINYLLSREKKGGTSAIYHILNKLPPNYAGICLTSTESSRNFYNHLGFTGTNYLFTLDKTSENIRKLEEKLPHPITTVFYSTYPDNQII